MKKERPILEAEKAPESRDQVPIAGRLHHRDISEKMGADGIIETHMTYTPTEKKYFGKPKSSYCGSCDTWIRKDYKWVGHKKGCKTQ